MQKAAVRVTTTTKSVAMAVLLGLIVLAPVFGACPPAQAQSVKEPASDSGTKAADHITPGSAEPFDAFVTVYRNLTCFNYKQFGRRHCADWRVGIRAGGALIWSINVTDVAITKETFSDSLIFGPDLRKKWAQILQKGLKWARIARNQKVNMEKLIANLGDTTQAVFVSVNQGDNCAVRLGNRGWTDKGPVYMYVPYEKDEYSTDSIQAFLRGLAAADSAIEAMIKKRKMEKKLFR